MSFTNKIRILVGAALMVAGLSACGGGGGVIIGGCTGSCDPGYTAWYDVYGHYCGNRPGPGCNFYADGEQIVDVEDPYFYNWYLDYATWTYTDSYGYRRTYTGYAWLSDSGILYDEYGYALNKLKNGQTGKDLIGDVAALEDKKVAAAGKAFATKYALAEATGVQIAKTLNDWAVLGKKRAKTDADLAAFTKRLYGISLDSAKSAIEVAQQGDMGQLENLNTEVAAHWGTSAETSKAILKSFYKKQLGSLKQ